MVTERLTKHCHGELQNILLWERGREGAEQGLGAQALEGWCTQYTHTNTHTWPVGIGLLPRRKVNVGWFVATCVFWVWSKRWLWLTTACSTFTTWSVQSWQTRGHYPPLLLDPCHLVSHAGRDSKGFSLPASLSHGMESSATLHIIFHQLLGPQFFKAAWQRPVVWHRNMFSEFYTEFLGFGWLLCGTCTVLCVLAMGRGFTPLYPVAASQLSRDLLCFPMVMEYSEF